MAEFATNESYITEFVILGFSNSLEQKVPLFLIFLLIYLFTLVSNLLIITLIFLHRNLHTPMYFFLCNLSFLDIFLTSVTAPNLLHNIISKNKRISFSACIAQLFLFNILTTVEYMLLTSMSYDRYQAICNPLRYYQNMNKNTCQIFAGMAWIGGFLAPLPIRVLVVLNCFILTVTSYVFIISTILKLSSSKGRRKAFSTCSSHLTAIILFYAMIASMYMKRPSSYSLDEGKVQSVLFSNIIPMLNPVIYTLKNNDVKETINRMTHISFKSLRSRRNTMK
ncbi:hypothetical protein GDO86_018006 [Hymenochirus boettgeri]|uniref:G-protein coupled receptors family 1 profile domain-containing protein n=1 Tax=Hymenochirus boettgeri TaxID=247094 RepID=A0A8T2ICL6_9PIPI|nr:hypothetical protein GDO86_018006 [Hymenochirus boettgeri]